MSEPTTTRDKVLTFAKVVLHATPDELSHMENMLDGPEDKPWRRYHEPGIPILPTTLTVKDVREMIDRIIHLGAADAGITSDFRLWFTVDASSDWHLREAMIAVENLLPNGMAYGANPDKVSDL